MVHRQSSKSKSGRKVAKTDGTQGNKVTSKGKKTSKTLVLNPCRPTKTDSVRTLTEMSSLAPEMEQESVPQLNSMPTIIFPEQEAESKHDTEVKNGQAGTENW